MPYSHKTLIPVTLLALLTLCLATSCHREESVDPDAPVDAESLEIEVAEAPLAGTDLWVFELRGPVKVCKKTIWFDVVYDGSDVSIDSTKTVHQTELYFDRQGQYVASASEKLLRDDFGRIVYWRDSRPNAKGVDPGVLRDTLRLEYLNDNVISTRGMGEVAVTVYDDDATIIGQQSAPDIESAHMTAFNIIRAKDKIGNWTERLTVWTSRSAHTRDHISYTLEQREIGYYKPLTPKKD